MNENNNFNGNSESEESFEDLLNQSMIETVYLSPGEAVEATVIKITGEWVFIDTGGKSEGYIVIDEFIDDEGGMSIKEGEKIKAYFLSSRNNEKLFTTRLTVDKAGKEFLEEAYYNKIPVEGVVEKEIKGGYEVKIAGNVRAFCPYSQMGLHREENGEKHIGSQLTFKIIEYGEKGRNLIISHRVILEEEREKQRDALRGSLKEGMTVEGEITSIRKFGAFADIGGIEGLIPVSEISWGRVEDVNDVLTVGQKVEVFIKQLDWGAGKFSFSLKEIIPDPWDEIAGKYPEGSSIRGRVSRITKFGAFVTLEPGIDGLLHISELGKGRRINHPREVVEEGQGIDVIVNRVNAEQKRLSLSLLANGQGSEEDDYKTILAKENKSAGSFGSLGDLLKEKLGKKK